MASISTLRVIPNTQVTLTFEAAAAVTNLSGHGDTSGYVADNRQPVASADQAQLSATGTVLARALSLSDVRFEKVAALREAIANGTYHVSSRVLAEQLIQALAG